MLNSIMKVVIIPLEYYTAILFMLLVSERLNKYFGSNLFSVLSTKFKGECQLWLIPPQTMMSGFVPMTKSEYTVQAIAPQD